MAFDSLIRKTAERFKNLRSKGNLQRMMSRLLLKKLRWHSLRQMLTLRLLSSLRKSVQERAIGQDVMNGLNPGQMVIKIVNEEMIKLMGSETTEIAFRPGKELTVIMMVGLQGAGKTTTQQRSQESLNPKARNHCL